MPRVLNHITALTRLSFTLSLLFILASYALEYIGTLTPCPLCLLQRAVMIGVCFFLFLSHSLPWLQFKRLSLILSGLASLLGALLAGRQLWLQHTPAGNTLQCLPNLHYLFQLFPITDALKMVVQGSSDCAITHLLLGLSLATWSLLAFTVLFILSCLAFLATLKQKKIETNTTQ